MEIENIKDCIFLGQNKYRYIQQTFDKMFYVYWELNIKKHCKLFQHFKLYRDELQNMINNFNKETKRLLLLKKFCCDIANEIILYV